MQNRLSRTSVLHVFLALGLIFGLTGAAIPSDSTTSHDQWNGEVTREWGADRYQTAALIADKFPYPDTIVIASGQDYPDAAVGATLGRGPILLTRQDGLPGATVQQLKKQKPRTIIVLGGPAAVSDNVVNELKQLAPNVPPRFFGNDRYGTAARVALEATNHADVPIQRVCVVGGQDDGFIEATLASASTFCPAVLLVRKDSVPGATTGALAELDPREVVVIGDTTKVSNAVYNAVGAIDRISGTSPYDLSLALADRFSGDVEAFVVVTGKNYAEALSGGNWGKAVGMPMIAVPDSLPNSDLHRWAADNRASRAIILGGTAAVTERVEQQLRQGL